MQCSLIHEPGESLRIVDEMRVGLHRVVNVQKNF